MTNINLLIKFSKTREIFPSVNRVLSILLTTAGTSASAQSAKSLYQRFLFRVCLPALCSNNPANI